MKYKIYRMVKNNGNLSGEVMSVIEDDKFKYEEFESIESAYEVLKASGVKYCNYTILPYIYLCD